MDCGELGVAAVTNTEDSQSSEKAALPERAITEWTATEIAPASDEPIQAAVDGEALVFDSPLVLSIRPKGLRLQLPKGVVPGFVSPAEAKAADWVGLSQLTQAPR
jgi:hypothetical protein